MYVVTENGHKLSVDTSSIPSDEIIRFQQPVGLYTSDTILNPVWILELNKRDWFANKKDFELEFVKELKYDHEPSQEEILWAMSAYGCDRGSIAFVRKGFELELTYD